MGSAIKGSKALSQYSGRCLLSLERARRRQKARAHRSYKADRRRALGYFISEARTDVGSQVAKCFGGVNFFGRVSMTFGDDQIVPKLFSFHATPKGTMLKLFIVEGGIIVSQGCSQGGTGAMGPPLNMDQRSTFLIHALEGPRSLTQLGA